jgi:YegS/Rv2252/BmrU family lipid kinase
LTAAIVNPAAGGGTAGRQWPSVAARLGPMQVCRTDRPGHATEVARRIECDRLVVAGGDGTLNEVVNGLMERTSAPPVEFVPLGSGSDFARTPAGTRKVDVFRARFRGGERYFVNIASCGLGAVAARDAGKWRMLPLQWRYLAAAIPSLARGQSYDVSVRVDDEPSVSFDATIVSIANGQYQGSGIRIAPHAKIDDGLADITIVRKVSLWEVGRNLPILYNGAIYSHPQVLQWRGRRVVVEGEAPLELDGEVVGGLPLEVEVAPAALSITCPEGLSRSR